MTSVHVEVEKVWDFLFRQGSEQKCLACTIIFLVADSSLQTGQLPLTGRHPRTTIIPFYSQQVQNPDICSFLLQLAQFHFPFRSSFFLQGEEDVRTRKEHLSSKCEKPPFSSFFKLILSRMFSLISRYLSSIVPVLRFRRKVRYQGTKPCLSINSVLCLYLETNL